MGRRREGGGGGEQQKSGGEDRESRINFFQRNKAVSFINKGENVIFILVDQLLTNTNGFLVLMIFHQTINIFMIKRKEINLLSQL